MKVTIYTLTTCSSCRQVKQYLTSKGVKYKEINLDKHPEKQAEAYKVSGALSAPITVVKKGLEKKVIIGYNLAKLAPAIR